MLVIEGAIQVVPHAVNVDTGELRAQGKAEPAIVQSYISQSGTVQVILPEAEIDRIIQMLSEAKNKIAQEKSGLYVPPTVEVGMDQAEAIKKTTDEITTPKQ